MEPLPSTDFPATDKSDWLAQVQKELKDPAASEHLRWQTGEGFVAEPYYTADDRMERSLPDASQQVQKHLPGWLNAPIHHLTDDTQADNAVLRDALAGGADALVLALPGAIPGKTETGDAVIQRLTRLLNGIKLSDNPVFFRTDADVVTLVTALKTVAPYQLKGGLLINAGVDTAEVTRLTADSPQFRTVCASSHAFHNAGATATQELAFTLATVADAYDSLTDAGLTIDQLVPKTILSVSVGTSYFMEIAKLRALRVLFGRFLSYYPSASTGIAPAHRPGQDQFIIQSGAPNRSVFIHAQTSAFYDAATTPYTNLIRATTEAMAAVVGGCDALTVRPYDAVLEQRAGIPGRDREVSDRIAGPRIAGPRIARNISVLLKEESYFDKVADPSAGSYYIENLTHQLAEAAWALFLDVEQRGGFAKAFETGFIADEIERAYRAKVEAVEQGRVLVGVTKFRHDETLPLKPDIISQLASSLLPNRRLAEKFE